jgi:hypothetical protein
MANNTNKNVSSTKDTILAIARRLQKKHWEEQGSQQHHKDKKRTHKKKELSNNRVNSCTAGKHATAS